MMTFCWFSFRNSITVTLLFWYDDQLLKKHIKKKILAIKIKKSKSIKLKVDKITKFYKNLWILKAMSL